MVVVVVLALRLFVVVGCARPWRACCCCCGVPLSAAVVLPATAARKYYSFSGTSGFIDLSLLLCCP